MERSQKAGKGRSEKEKLWLRVVDEWNRLPDEAKRTDRLRVFNKEIQNTV
jgi:hypothetical protein